ncbi:MAG: hypothetical protein IKP97_00230 [Kiritimatiellae bacterium]|nr:hypothetical protein [Kiritimatiellia bacterium]
MKRFGKGLRWTVKAMKLVFIAFCIFAGSLFFRQQSLPAEWVERCVQERLPDTLRFTLGEASFGFKQGLYLGDLKLFDLARKDATTPLVAAEELYIDFIARKVRAVGAFYDKLPDSYYEPGGYAYGPRSQMAVPPPPWDFRLPKLPTFKLIAERPCILGLRPQSVEGEVKVRPLRAEINNIKVEWPRQAALPMVVAGYIFFDISDKRLKGECAGLATQPFIRPHLVILDIPVSLPYMDGFTGVKGPIPAYFSWDVNLDTGHTVLEVGVHPVLGEYNRVPMKRADGKIKIEVWYRDGFMESDVTIGPVTAYDAEGRQLEGGFVVHRRNAEDAITLDFDAKSDLPFKDVLSIIDCLNDGTLDDFKCDAPPRITVKGLLAAEPERQGENDLHGTVETARCTLFDIPMIDAKADYAYVGDTVTFTNVTARGMRGGDIKMWAALKVPAGEPESATADVDIAYTRGSVEEVADYFDFDLGDKKGKLEGTFHFSGPLTTNMVNEMDGFGRVRIEDGHLAQMKLFAGMTAALAEYVPGVATIVNQNTGSCTFTLENGVFKTDDILIEGGLFSISAAGTYNIPEDDLDFLVRMEFTRKDSMLGRYVVRPILLPFAKLLLEFKVRGPIDDAEWDYQGILDKVGL